MAAGNSVPPAVGCSLFMLDMLQVGDPLADAVILEIDELGKEAKRQLNQGLAHGPDSLDNPPQAAAAFLTQLETLPEWIDHEALVAGDVGDLSIPPLWNFLTAAGLQLSHVYASPSCSFRRGRSPPCRPGAPGYVSTAQIRLLHARVRHTATKHGWDGTEWGVPINQVDVARTWLDFIAVPFLAARKLGIVFTEEEQAERYRYWSYLGHLLGLDERFHLAVRSDDDAEALLDLLDSTVAEPDDNSRALTEASPAANAEALAAGPLSMLDRATLRDLFNGLLRFYYGDRFADAMRLPPSRSAGLIPLLGAAAAQSWQLQRSTPETAALARERFTAIRADAAEALTGHTAYQTNVSAETPESPAAPVA